MLGSETCNVNIIINDYDSLRLRDFVTRLDFTFESKTIMCMHKSVD